MSNYPIDIPPYQIQPIVANVAQSINRSSGPLLLVTCAQALGSEIYVGCSNGELVRFALQIGGGDASESYTVLSQQSLPGNKPIDSLVLIPSVSRALVQCDHQVYFYTLPALDPIPPQVVKPLRNVITFAVDEQHLRRPPPSSSDPRQVVEPAEFCVIKRNAILLYSIGTRLQYQKAGIIITISRNSFLISQPTIQELPFSSGAALVRRTGHFLCLADKEFYNIVDLESASLFPLLPLSQAPDVVVKPCITVVSENEFLLFSWTGVNTMGVFITGEGVPVRGTLEWATYPEAVCLDYPHIITLLPDDTIEIHNIDTQTLIQTIPAAQATPDSPIAVERKRLAPSSAGFLVPSSQRLNKLRPTPVRLVRSRGNADLATPREGEAVA